MMKSMTQINKEMNLKKFLHRQRLLTVSVHALLTGFQSAYVTKISRLVLRDSSDSERFIQSGSDISDDDARSTANLRLVARSRDATSKRLLEALELRYGSTKFLQDKDKGKGLLNYVFKEAKEDEVTPEFKE